MTAAAAALLVLVVSCTPADRDDVAPPPSSPNVPSDPALLASEVDLGELAGTRALDGLAWVLWALEGDPPSLPEIERVMSAQLLAEVPALQLRQILGQLSGDYRLTRLDEATPLSLIGEIDDGTRRWTLLLGVADGDELVIETLFFQLPLGDPPDLEDWDDATRALGGFAEHLSYLAARVEDDTCVPIAGAATDQRRPIGSAFKLYVLGALADAVAAGTHAWDDDLVLDPALVSLPSGRLQDEPPGTRVALAEAAQLMISISDNTATDHLIDLLGRDVVEQAQAGYGHGDPSVNQPFLTTRELFQLKWQVDATERARYLEADEDGRRAILAELADRPLEVTPVDVSGVVEPERLEWFASPEELCAALVALDARASEPGMEPLGEALGANPIVRLDQGTWRRWLGKGGSEPGVLAFAWLLEDDRGDRWSFGITLSSDAPIDEFAAIPVIEAALLLLARER